MKRIVEIVLSILATLLTSIVMPLMVITENYLRRREARARRRL